MDRTLNQFIKYAGKPLIAHDWRDYAKPGDLNAGWKDWHAPRAADWPIDPPTCEDSWHTGFKCGMDNMATPDAAMIVNTTGCDANSFWHGYLAARSNANVFEAL